MAWGVIHQGHFLSWTFSTDLCQRTYHLKHVMWFLQLVLLLLSSFNDMHKSLPSDRAYMLFSIVMADQTDGITHNFNIL
jgi:hypothetical protein